MESPQSAQTTAVEMLSEQFGMPTHAAESYIGLLLGKRTKRLALSEELFGRK
jgi:hypothetical protein